MVSPKQETQWVLRAQSGDRVALDELFKAVQEPLYRYLRGLVGEPSLTEDILQNVFVRIYRKLAWLREPELFRPWVYRMATREAFKWLKKERRWRDLVRDESIVDAVAAPPPREAFAPELMAQLPQLVAGVSPASRAVLILHYLHEMSLQEVADVLGVALGTVKSRLAYGLSCLRQTIEERNLSGESKGGAPRE